MENNITLEQALEKIKELEKRIKALEQRPVYVPVDQPQHPHTPVPQFPYYPYYTTCLPPVITTSKNTL